MSADRTAVQMIATRPTGGEVGVLYKQLVKRFHNLKEVT